MNRHNDRNSKQFIPHLEGLMSADSGPQSSKEELGLSMEELLELNEKLVASNAELRGKVEELTQANNEMEDALKESEQRCRLKLESILAPEGDIGNLELGDIIDARMLQSLVDDFHELTRMPMSLVDVNGKVLAGVGWQEICTKFHRINPDTCRNCIESDVQLSAGVPLGEYKIYRCKNNMWDVATPVMLGDRRFGNLFMGQFFFEDEQLDYELFRAQAGTYRFDESEYIAALEAVPRLSRKNVNTCMTFFMKLAGVLSRLSYSNLKLARSLSERDALMLSLNKSEQRLQLFIEHAPAALAMFDTEMCYLSVSRRWLGDYGLGGRALIGESHYDVFPEVSAEWREAHRRGLAGEVLRAEGDRFERVDGSVQWVRWEIRPWYDAEGKIGGIVIFAEEITDIKEAEEILRRYQLLAGHSRDIFLYVRRDDRRILEANAAAVNAYGYSHEELLGLTVKELRAPGTVGLTDAQMAEADTHGILFETVHRRRDGSIFPVEVSSQGATIGGTRTLISVIRDITERKRDEKALRESEIRYHGLFENMLEGFAYCRMLFDEHGHPADFVYLDVNKAFGRLTGLEGVTGKKVTEIIPGIKESHPELFEIYGRVALTGQTERFEIKIEPFGIWLAISVYSPEKEHFIAVFDNINERKRAEEELFHKNQRLESMAIELSLAEERERDRIAGELHDQVGQRLILGKMKLGALASQIQTDKCINDVEELDRIIDLSIQDIRSLTFQLRPPLLASAGLEAALHWLGEEFRETYGLLPTYSDDGQQKPMRYEARSTVFQAAREMLLNTVKHADATHIGINIRRDADMLRVCLSDNGRGFDVAEARMKKSKLGGFGLINVQRRIEHLGGSITIESRPGNGTRVTIMAPLDLSQ